MADDKDNKPKWLTRNPVVLGAAAVALVNYWSYAHDPHEYDRNHPSPEGGEPEVVFLATTSAVGYLVVEPSNTMVPGWKLVASQAHYVQRITPSDGSYAFSREPEEDET